WHTQFEADNQCIRAMLLARSQAIDEIIKRLWQQHDLHHTPLALFAVGGYGRQEMLPCSDVDLMLFAEHDLSDSQEQAITAFVSSLWDISSLKPAISVRTLQQCIDGAKQDITIATALIEARLILGDAEFASYPRKIVSQTWSDETFFAAKQQEQAQRYAQYSGTESTVEPDIKNSPGGLRDIHQIGWIAKRHFRVHRIFDLSHLGFLSEFELHNLEQAEQFLWKIRYYLHRITKRDENRLLFDYQKEIAHYFGYHQQQNQSPNEAIERFMKQYYRIAQQVSTLNEILLSYFMEAVVTPRLANYHREIIELNERFKLVDGGLAVQHHKVFAESPYAILELFYLWASHAEINHIRARTLRLLMLAAKKIDENFRQNPKHHALFLQILRCKPERSYPILLAMKRYGVLGAYIPAFEQITGLMQYDLFHIYTVDAHTLFLIRNLNRFASDEFAQAFPMVSQVYKQLKRYDLLFLAAIFHDIAKGRNGDHSILGAEDALIFCRQHGLPEAECQFVAWLIRYHLFMSVTAQKKDISDPEVVVAFAQHMKDIEHLDYLYCLTVADINATNPKLWNSWRASLMRQLYVQTKAMIASGLNAPIDHQHLIDETKQHALQKLNAQFATQDIEQLWQGFGDDYFLKESADDIAWHTQAILQHSNENEPLIIIRPHRKSAQDAVQIFIYTPDQPYLFARTVSVLDRMDLDVLDAKIITAPKGFSLDSYVVLDRFGTLVTDSEREQEVKSALHRILHHHDEPLTVKQRRIPRQLRHFNVQTSVKMSLNESLQQNVIEIITLDQPGLLAKIGAIFVQHNIEIHSARIATLGERAEDLFFITHRNALPLNAEEARQFSEQLTQALNEFSQQLYQS
ncbi:MAG: [protein-PII] uridylyltransferase, partial [Acinetobacter sp.]|nr:[protein-PII] uridylyltransferase [Acinetobacter sp.]